MPQFSGLPPDDVLDAPILTEANSEIDYARRRKLAQRIVDYAEYFSKDFEHDNWNCFELEFLESMQDKLEANGDTLMLSEKQEGVLERIIRRYDIP